MIGVLECKIKPLSFYIIKTSVDWTVINIWVILHIVAQVILSKNSMDKIKIAQQ